MLFASFPVASSDGVPRAVKRAGGAGAPSTPGGLGVFIGMKGSLGMVADIKLFRKLDQRAVCILSCSFF